MFFILQNEPVGRDPVQNAIIQDVLDHNKFSHSYEYVSIMDFYKDDTDEDLFSMKKVLKTPEDFDERYREAIPIGTVRFVETYLRMFKGIERDNAIEIPPILRTDEFLKRKYSIVPRDSIPRQGCYFIKDATQQKVFSYKGELEYFLHDEMFRKKTNEFDTSIRLDPSHLYQVSEIVNILAEYRVYVLNREINSMCIFAGDPLIFPDADLVRKAVRLINGQPDSPRSYSLDLMITPRGTAVTEVHNFLSVGLYTVDWDEELLYAFKHGMDYVMRYNTEQTKFTDF